MDIGGWIVLGVLVACCVVPMLMMARHRKHGSDGKGRDTGPQDR